MTSRNFTDHATIWAGCLFDAVAIILMTATMLMLAAVLTKANAATLIDVDPAVDPIGWLYAGFLLLAPTAVSVSLLALIPVDRFASKSARRFMIRIAIIVWPLAVLLLPVALLYGARARKDEVQQ